MMNSKTTLTFATIAMAAAMLTISSMAGQAFASTFPGSQGQGHEETDTCVQGDRSFGEDCPGESQKSPNRDECTTITAGKSDNIKDQDCEGEDVG